MYELRDTQLYVRNEMHCWMCETHSGMCEATNNLSVPATIMHVRWLFCELLYFSL